jgi:hypothetical protein
VVPAIDALAVEFEGHGGESAVFGVELPGAHFGVEKLDGGEDEVAVSVEFIPVKPVVFGILDGFLFPD